MFSDSVLRDRQNGLSIQGRDLSLADCLLPNETEMVRVLKTRAQEISQSDLTRAIAAREIARRKPMTTTQLRDHPHAGVDMVARFSTNVN
jgi:hypothetical protein